MAALCVLEPVLGVRPFMVLVVLTLSAGLYLALLARRVRRSQRSDEDPE